MMKNFIRKNVTKKKVLTLALVMLAMTPMLAQGGATAISNAASDIKDYWDPIKLILKAVGGLVGFIGGLRVYNGYGGAMIFLIVVPEFVTAFFA
jgi:hypothetical protein